MQTLSSSQERALTVKQAREFLEERRGLYSLNRSQIYRFAYYIHQFEKELKSR
ncbi:MAG: hypothetical protein P1U40_08190 [Coxiellaceae bacterium]|nr:hypothetical protein [Coxiellaceae bacterium]